MRLHGWREFMVPVLRLLSDAQERRLRELYEQAAIEVATTGQRTETAVVGQPAVRELHRPGGQLSFQHRRSR
jgi:restriction endonuclease Mrr